MSDGHFCNNDTPDTSKGDKTAELLHEATQLLKTLRVPANPKLKVMQLSNIEPVDDEYILVDSGATHALRPARDADEWQKSDRTTVQLADGSTEMFRLKKGTKILLVEPSAQVSWIIPMGGLSDLDFSLEWGDGLCKLRDDEGREIPVELKNGCPMISKLEGEKILQWLEGFYVHQCGKLAVVKTLIADEAMVHKNCLDLEVAMTLPWNRHKRRKIQNAKNVILHIFSGPYQRFWEQQCSTASTAVLCVNTDSAVPANLRDKNVFVYLAVALRLRPSKGHHWRASLQNYKCFEVSE